MKRRWTRQEEEWLRENYRKLGLAECSARLGRSKESVRKKAERLRLTGADQELIRQLHRENLALKLQLESLEKTYGVIKWKHAYEGEWVRFGVVSDSHAGSLYEAVDVWNLAYDMFEREGVEKVYHAGDLLDGEKMYEGHEYELHTLGADAQVRYFVDNYPRRKGISTCFILGNHDMKFWRRAGVDVGEKISQARKDMIFLGREEADVVISSSTGKAVLRLVHPGKGTAYAISYHPQNYIRSLPGGRKPNIVLMGHYHKAEYIPYRNVHLVQTGCMQHQTPFMRRRNNAAVVGFWIVETKLDERGVAIFKAWFTPVYEEPDWRDTIFL